MNTESVRPHVERLSIHLYDRPIHPELIETVASRCVRRPEFTLWVRLTPTGHVITWQSPELHLCEVAAADEQPLPAGGRLLERRLREEQTETIIPKAGYCYQVSAQVEMLSPQIFAHVQEEILAEVDRGALVHQFSTRHRLSPSPVSLATQEIGRGFVSVAMFHTFPDETAILKTQTLIEFGL